MKTYAYGEYCHEQETQYGSFCFLCRAGGIPLVATRGGSSIGSYDKVAHFITYGIFAVLAHRMNLLGRQYIYVCIGIVAYSGLLEIAQSLVPGREMSAFDLLANTSGVLLGALLCNKLSDGVSSEGKDHGIS